MPEFYDRLEARTPAARESLLFRDLRHILGLSKPRVASLRAQLRGIDVAALSTCADLAQIPLMRRCDLLARQADAPPYGGFSAMRSSGLKQTFVGPANLVSLEGQARDWWGMGRALFAAGLRKGTLALNCFPYDLVTDGHMVSSGAAAVGAPLVPAGAADLARKLDVIERLKPGFFCGRSSELETILNEAMDRKIDASCMKNALVTGPTHNGRRSEYVMRGFDVRHVFMLPELGAVAYETDDTPIMTVGEGYVVEIVDPRTGVVLGPGESGELVVTRVNADVPILRYATGATSSIATRPSSCGRTNTRITFPHQRTPESVETSGHRIHVADLHEIAKRHPTVGRISLLMRYGRGRDMLHLRVEHSSVERTLIEGLSETLHRVTRLRGTVELVAPGSLSDDDAVIIDERHLN